MTLQINQLILDGIENLRKDVSHIKAEIAVINANIDQIKEELEKRSIQLDTLNTQYLVLDHRTKTLNDEFDTHLVEGLRVLDKMKIDGFPDGDLGKHKSEHLEMNRREGDMRTIKKDAISYFIKGIGWAAVVGIFIACKEYFKGWIMK